VANFKRVKPGDSITADDFNAIAERIERFANLSVADGGHLRLWSGPTGKSLALAIPQDTIARLSGTTSPYSWTEAVDASSGAYVVRANANSGALNAYEVNGVSGLDGKIVWLTWSAARDWRFQWVGYGPPPPCVSGRICVTIDSDGCSPATPVYGATVTVTDSAEPPNTVGTGVTTGQVTALSLTNQGSGYSDGTGYPLAISGDGSGAAGTFDVIGGQVTNLALTDGGSDYTSATISFPGAGSGTGAAASATVKGRCCIGIPSAGTYGVNVHVPGATDRTATVNAVCNQDNFVSVSYPTNSLGTFCVSAVKCGVGVIGMLVIVSKSGDGTVSGTTDASGNFCLRLGVGTGYSYTATVGSATFTGNFVIGACATTSRTFSVIGDYYFQVRSSLDIRNNGCSGTFTLYQGFDNTGPVLVSQAVTLTLDDGGEFCVSPLYHSIFSDVPNTTQVHYELLFPNFTSQGTFSLGCTSPMSFESYFTSGNVCI
jgi:hypothetical protein